ARGRSLVHPCAGNQRIRSRQGARRSVDLMRLGFQLTEFNWPQTRIAASLKARHRMSYADCFAAALAKHHKADLVTGDKEFKQVEGDVSVHWL
ncbi:MAG: PIN domain-containing protein, partial [Betaproteobacteria bacterium]